MITDDKCQRAQHIIFDSGAAQLFRDALRGTSGRGRKTGFDHGLYLLGMHLAIVEFGKAHIRLIHTVLTEQVPLAWQVRWGIRSQKPDGTWVLIQEHQLQNSSRQLAKMLDFTPTRLPDHKVKGDAAAERARRKELVEEVLDTLLQASVIARPDDAYDYAVDGTGIWAAELARGKTTKVADTTTDDELSEARADAFDQDGEAEPDSDDDDFPDLERVRGVSKKRKRAERVRSDAAWGWKTSKEGGRGLFFGYDLHAVVRVPNRNSGEEPRPEPALVEFIRVTPAASDVVEPTLQMLDQVLSRGQRIRKLFADRLYSYKAYHRWLQPLLERDIEQVVELTVKDQGFTVWGDSLVKVAAGHVHCPSTPDHLGSIPKPKKDATAEKWAEFDQRIAERRAYAARLSRPMRADGSTRWECPALNGSIGCPLREGTMQAAVDLGLPIVASPPKSPPPICTQGSIQHDISTPAEAIPMKVHQRLYWGTEKHTREAARRTYVEGFFGLLKSATSVGLKRGNSLTSGLAYSSILFAMFAVAGNIKALVAWHKETGLGDPGHPLLAENPNRFGFVYLTEEEMHEHLARHARAAALAA